MTDNAPSVIFWRYSDEYLLPSRLDLAAFRGDPEICKPLQNLFVFAGFADIDAAFENAMSSDGDYENLLEDVSATATGEFAKRWPDLKGLSFVIAKDGDELSIKIKEGKKYNFEDRSDGFKQFVSILLMLSAQVESQVIKGAMILIDEPDRSLYPTGAKYLKDELIRLSTNNYVFYTTHSPFMVDNKNLERHVIVSKKKEVTEIEYATDSNFKDDDVLLNSIGLSKYEFIKEKNIIFEGYRDSCFFKIALKTQKKEYKDLVKFFREFGITYCCGCKDVKTVVPLLYLSNKSFYIFTDSDKAALDNKKEYEKHHGEQCCSGWYTFMDLGGRRDETVEDYFVSRAVLRAYKACKFEEKYDETKHVMHQDAFKDKDKASIFKELIFKDCKTEDVSESYYVVLKNLMEIIQGSQV